MFGDFMKQFSLSFPFQGVDAQGGMFAPNAPEIPGNVGSTLTGGSPVAPGAGMAAPGLNSQQAPAAQGAGGQAPLGGSPLAQQSPLAGLQQSGRIQTDEQRMDDFNRGLGIFNRQDPSMTLQGPTSRSMDPGEQVPDRERGGLQARDVRII